MSHLINAVPIGRLGNQMFQIAACLGYAKKYHATWGFPSDTKEVPHLRKMFPGVPVLDGNFRRFNVSDPAHFNYRAIPQFGGDTTMVGFFQSEKWFEGAQDQIRELFKLNIQSMSGHLSLHVRRGDYIQHPNSFPTITFDYIQKAINAIESQSIDVYNIHVFSDDIAWCKDNLARNINTKSSSSHWYYHTENEFDSMSLMASCPINIIANSTFSWWASWLNPNPEKIVVSPSHKNWFGPDNGVKNPKDVIPESWIQIEY